MSLQDLMCLRKEMVFLSSMLGSNLERHLLLVGKKQNAFRAMKQTVLAIYLLVLRSGERERLRYFANQ